MKINPTVWQQIILNSNRTEFVHVRRRDGKTTLAALKFLQADKECKGVGFLYINGIPTEHSFNSIMCDLCPDVTFRSGMCILPSRRVIRMGSVFTALRWGWRDCLVIVDNADAIDSRQRTLMFEHLAGCKQSIWLHSIN